MNASDAAIERLDLGTLAVAALRGWIAGVLFGALILGIYWVGNLAISSTSLGEFLSDVIYLPVAAVVVILFGGILALPAPILAVIQLLPAERFARQTRNLPVWLAIGFVASLPTARYVWGMTAFLTHDADGWSSLGLPLLILVCGIIGAFFGWRAEGRIPE